MPKPIFLVNQYGPEQRRNRGSLYGARTRETWWRAGMIHGYFPGVGMDFFFEAEHQASRFSLWTIYDPNQIIEAATPQNQQYIVNDIWNSWISLPNPYGGPPFKMEVWYVGMKAENVQQEIELRFPVQAEAERFSRNRGYSVTDLVGTLRAIPSEIADQLAEAAEIAKFQDQQKQAFEEQQRQIQQEELRRILTEQAAEEGRKYAPPDQPPPPPTPPPTPPPLIESTSVFDILIAAGFSASQVAFVEKNDPEFPAMMDALQNYVGSRYTAEAGLTVRNYLVDQLLRADAYAQPATGAEYRLRFRTYRYNQVWHPTGRPLQTTDQEWFISNGGSVGNYDGQHFLTGTFPYAQSGIWFGSYVLA